MTYCTFPAELLVKKLLNTIEEEDLKSLNKHMESCKVCQDRYNDLEKTRKYVTSKIPFKHLKGKKLAEYSRIRL